MGSDLGTWFRAPLWRLTFSWGLLAAAPTEAAEWHVAPGGSGSGPGTASQPYDLATALSGEVGGPGDTFWLHGGDYQLGRIATTIHGAPGQPITFRQAPGARARINGSLSVWDSIGYVVFRDFELYSSDTNRVSAQIGVGFSPTDISIIPGVSSYAPNCSFINLIVHDQTRHGFYLAEIATNNLVYGCVVYNNGWVAPDNSEGHNFYVQSEGGMTEIADNVAFNNCGANLHIYQNSIGGRLAGVTIDGNIAFNAGALPSVRAYRDWVVGVDWPSFSADEIVFNNNMGYLPPGSGAYSQVQLGRQGVNGSLVMIGNYMPLGLMVNNWCTVNCAQNVFAPQGADYIVDLQETLTAMASAWDKNSFSCPGGGKAFRWNMDPCTLPEWQDVTGFDWTSSYQTGNLRGTAVFVRPNRYELGRAHIAVYNWDNRSTVPVDVASVLKTGTRYEVRNAQDFFAPPVLSGTFNGQPLVLPMRGLTVAKPNGPLEAPPPTGPTFNVFVLLPLASGLRLSVEARQLQISWPVDSGYDILESNQSPCMETGWTEVTNSPAINEGQYVVWEILTSTQKFYRVRSR